MRSIVFSLIGVAACLAMLSAEKGETTTEETVSSIHESQPKLSLIPFLKGAYNVGSLFQIVAERTPAPTTTTSTTTTTEAPVSLPGRNPIRRRMFKLVPKSEPVTTVAPKVETTSESEVVTLPPLKSQLPLSQLSLRLEPLLQIIADRTAAPRTVPPPTTTTSKPKKDALLRIRQLQSDNVAVQKVIEGIKRRQIGGKAIRDYIDLLTWEQQEEIVKMLPLASLETNRVVSLAENRARALAEFVIEASKLRHQKSSSSLVKM